MISHCWERIYEPLGQLEQSLYVFFQHSFFSKAPWWNHIPKNKACFKVTADRKYKLDPSPARAGRVTGYKFRLSISVQVMANQSKWTAWHKLLLTRCHERKGCVRAHGRRCSVNGTICLRVNERQFGAVRCVSVTRLPTGEKAAADDFSSTSHFPTPHHADASLYIEPSPLQTFCSWITPTCQRLENVRLPK